MMQKLVHEAAGARTFVAIFETGDEVMSCLLELAVRERITGASMTAIGAFSRAVLAYFDWERKAYLDIRLDEQVEVASMIGDIGVDDAGDPAIHVHLVLGCRDGSAMAGHLLEARVRPTLEMVVTETPAYLHRCKDPATGLNLIRL